MSRRISRWLIRECHTLPLTEHDTHTTQGILRGKPVAVKKIHIGLRRDGQIDERTSEVLEDFRNECAVMRFSSAPAFPLNRVELSRVLRMKPT